MMLPILFVFAVLIASTVTREVGQCADDPRYNCQQMQMSSSFNICADIVQAKTTCRKWCGLCNLGLVEAGCPNGWTYFDGSCYLLPQQSANFLDAKSHCSLLHGHIVNIGSQSEDAFIKSFLSAHKDHLHWIGFNDIAVENVWVWADTDDKGSFTDWAPDQPHGGTSENCVVLNDQVFQWHDYSCDHNFNFICEKSQHTETEIIG